MFALIHYFKENCCRSRYHRRAEDEMIQEMRRTPREYALVAKRFRFWVEKYQHHSDISLRSKLLEWLKDDLGYKYTVKYKDFREIALLILDQDLIPSREEFWKAYDEARRDHLGPEQEVCFEPKVLQNFGGI